VDASIPCDNAFVTVVILRDTVKNIPYRTAFNWGHAITRFHNLPLYNCKYMTTIKLLHTNQMNSNSTAHLLVLKLFLVLDQHYHSG
jgi:hypothetical protein